MATAVAVITRPATPEQASLWSDAWRRLRRNRMALISAVYLLFIVAVALVALVHTPYSYREVGVASRPLNDIQRRHQPRGGTGQPMTITFDYAAGAELFDYGSVAELFSGSMKS